MLAHAPHARPPSSSLQPIPDGRRCGLFRAPGQLRHHARHRNRAVYRWVYGVGHTNGSGMYGIVMHGENRTFSLAKPLLRRHIQRHLQELVGAMVQRFINCQKAGMVPTRCTCTVPGSALARKNLIANGPLPFPAPPLLPQILGPSLRTLSHDVLFADIVGFTVSCATASDVVTSYCTLACSWAKLMSYHTGGSVLLP